MSVLRRRAFLTERALTKITSKPRSWHRKIGAMRVMGEDAKGADWHVVTVRIGRRHRHRDPMSMAAAPGFMPARFCGAGDLVLGMAFPSPVLEGLRCAKFVIFLTCRTAKAAARLSTSQWPVRCFFNGVERGHPPEK